MRLRGPLLLFGLLLSVPAVALAALAYRSVDREHRDRLREARAQAFATAQRFAAEQARSLERVRAREDARPYYHWQDRYQPEGVWASNGPAFLESPLRRPPDDRRILGWFQWVYASGVMSGPETFGPDTSWRRAFLTAYGPTLRARLAEAPTSSALRSAPPRPVPVETVAANEEVGKLLEEVQVAQQELKNTAYLDDFVRRTQNRGAAQTLEPQVAVQVETAKTEEAKERTPGPGAASTATPPSAPADSPPAASPPAPAGALPLPAGGARPLPPPPPSSARTAPVADGASSPSTSPPPAQLSADPFTDASPSPTVDVRVTPFTYLVRPPGAGPSVVAFRWVWIPGQAERERRDAPTDRWMLQGYALDPGATLPGPEAGVEGGVRLRRADAGPAGTGDAGVSVLYGLPYELLDAPPAWRDLVARFPRETLAAPPPSLPAATRRDLEDVVLRRGLDPSLRVLYEPDLGPVEEQHADELGRLHAIVAGLILVVGLGLFVLVRSVRREVDVAQRKEDFVAAVTHELKTPLAGIRMYADMLKEGWVPEGETAEDYAQRIVDETKRLGSLVDQVLDLASFDRGVATFTPLAGDLGAAVRDAAAMCLPAAKEAGVPVAVDVEAGLPPVRFDGALVRPIVLNLVDNAVKYSARSATKDVRVSVRRDGDRVALVVADRGVGIPVADRKRVFEPFFRSGREETRTARGVGLGLALVDRYVRAHGATLALESEEGRGTTVTVRFPA